MALGETRIALRGESPYPHENEAIDFIIEALPNTDPYTLWALTELADSNRQRLYEVDAIILGYAAVYLVEIKSHPGRLRGNHMDWVWHPPDGGKVRMLDSPLPSVNLKAKVLASQLERHMPPGVRRPWVQPLIFLSVPDVKLDFSPQGRMFVVTRETFKDAITHHRFDGADSFRQGRRVDRPTQRAVHAAFRELGLGKRAADITVGAYTLGRLIDQGPGFRDYEAQHSGMDKLRRRARVYQVPQATSTERRAQLRRAADREALLLTDVGQHENVLTVTDYVPDAAAGPTILFEEFDEGQKLDAFLRTHPDLSFDQRVELVEQIALALAYCHRRSVHHRSVGPDAVLVRMTGSQVETRLCNFQLGGSEEASATKHVSALSSELGSLFQAPELRDDPGSLGPAADLFSLGATASYIFTGKAPADSGLALCERLARDRSLDPRASDDNVPEAIAELISQATQLVIANRSDDAEKFAEQLLEAVTRPEVVEEAEADPLQAKPGDRLAHGFEVVGLLGHGATARVLRVRKDKAEYALKVSVGPEHDARIESEARVLARLSHPRLVRLESATRAPLEVGGRKALQLSIVGGETLYKALQREGTVSLDYAIRYGEDLLEAVAYLEDERVGHRDIKPANIGVGVRKGKKEAYRLTLFDFSLSEAPATQIESGTAVYRDPFLRERGAWDSAADLWSVAVTLHEMLTGKRPSYGGTQSSALDPDAELVLSPDRFDPGVRGQLEAFFRRALARGVTDRFDSANEMRRAWSACFAPVEQPEIGAPDVKRPPTADELTDQQLAEIVPDTLVAALPLTPRARNALDRAGLVYAQDLLALPDNRLSAIRGIGSSVAREVLDFRDRWAAARKIDDVDAQPFYPGFHGEDLFVAMSGLSTTASKALTDAGLSSLAALAGADKTQVGNLARRHGFAEQELTDLLDQLQRAADEHDHPVSLEGWVHALLPEKKNLVHPRRLFGLEGPLVGRIDVGARELARALKVTDPAIYQALQRSARQWSKHPAIGELRDHVHAVLQELAGAAPLVRAADVLALRLPHENEAERDSLRVQAAALLRVVCQVEHGQARGLLLSRLDSGALWITYGADHTSALKKLGALADELAQRDTLASSTEVARLLTEAAQETPFAGLATDRLVELAALASQQAARSTRMEIYPRLLEPARAIKLTASVLSGQLSVDEVHRRVRQRYPVCDVLPTRPRLDELLQVEGLVWDESKQVYARPDTSLSSPLVTDYSSVSRQRTALATQKRAVTEASIEARRFNDRLRTALDQGRFFALKVLANDTERATLALAGALQVTPVSLDRALLDELKAMEAEDDFPLVATALEVDGLGPADAESWADLVGFMEQAADRLAAKLLCDDEQPLLLVQPGLLQRYGLDEFLPRFIAATDERGGDSRAVVVVIPSHDIAGPPRINGQLSIPGLQKSQYAEVPRSWIENRHNEAA